MAGGKELGLLLFNDIPRARRDCAISWPALGESPRYTFAIALEGCGYRVFCFFFALDRLLLCFLFGKKKGERGEPHPIRDMHPLSSVYPRYRQFIDALSQTPLSFRSLCIKACQSQHTPDREVDSVLTTLFIQHPSLVISDFSRHHIVTLDAIDFLSSFSLTLEDPLTSAIILDICRGVPLSLPEVQQARLKSWNGELVLALGTKPEPQVDFSVFFQDDLPISTPIHPRLPANPNMTRAIRYSLRRFRDKQKGRILYPRATHKNMSRSTRRHFEDITGDSLETIPIFGQDDWQRFYNRTGIKLEGDVELRQKWYPSGAKPRTYAAQGGTTYNASRHLQDFFTDLVNTFEPTHHLSRLRPQRLFPPPPADESEDPNYLIYDLSSFTSNMIEQVSFCRCLAEFMVGVPAYLVDERTGIQEVDFGDLLWEYVDICVDGPIVSMERFHPDMAVGVPHQLASLLGIFGNLMTCTTAHFLIMSPTTPSFDSINVAGDDGLVIEDRRDNMDVHTAISLVGAYALEKTFKGDDPCAICLKRPFISDYPRCHLLDNLVPPTASVALALCGHPDPRYQTFQFEELDVNEKISIIGKDMLRFLRAAYIRKYDDIDQLDEVYRGFKRLADGLNGSQIFPNVKPYIWPFGPREYDFDETDPALVLAIYRGQISARIYTRREVGLELEKLRWVGESFECNSTRLLVLLERLEYIEKEEVFEEVTDIDAIEYVYARLAGRRFNVPVVNVYTVLREIPEGFLVID